MKHLFHATYQLLGPDGQPLTQPSSLKSNFIALEGEQSILNVYFLNQANPTKYLALLSGAASVSTVMSTMTEAVTPGANSYNRQQILDSDWSAPFLDNGDYESQVLSKTFGPATTANWSNITYLAIVTTLTGTGGLFLAAVNLGSVITVPVGQSFFCSVYAKALN